MTTLIDRQTRTIPRDGLRLARRAVDDAITAPSADNLMWSMTLLTALRKLNKVFEKHVSDAEGDEGSLIEVLAMKPHLQRRVRRMRQDHELIRVHLREVIAAAEQQMRTSIIHVESLRQSAGNLVDEVRLHQARGVDLVYEAFHRVDGFG
jgi:hypothetical protein